jgi:hypothetical protein
MKLLKIIFMCRFKNKSGRLFLLGLGKHWKLGKKEIRQIINDVICL